MERINSLEALNVLKDQYRADIEETTVKVTMATCGIASGSREVMDAMIQEVEHQGVENVSIMQTGCMGYCYAEPTVEITLPNRTPVIFGNVDAEKAKELVTKYIVDQELVEGIINEKFQKID